MQMTLARVVGVERHRSAGTLAVNIQFVGGQDPVRNAEVLEVVENGIIVSENGHTKLCILHNATTVEFVHV